MPKVDIPKLRELLKAGTAGPWDAIKTRYFGVPNEEQHWSIGSDVVKESIAQMVGTQGEPVSHDANLIVSAINALPEMLDELTELRADKELMKNWLANKTDAALSNFESLRVKEEACLDVYDTAIKGK